MKIIHNLWTIEEFNAELEKGYTDMKEGKVRPASDVFDDLQKDYGILDEMLVDETE